MTRYRQKLLGASVAVTAFLGSGISRAQESEAPAAPTVSAPSAHRASPPAAAAASRNGASAVDPAASEEVKRRSSEAEALALAGETSEAKAALSEAKQLLGAASTDAKQDFEGAKKVVDKQSESKCVAGDAFQLCFYVGVFVASGSLTGLYLGDYHGGKTSRTLVSAAIPAIGLRSPIDSKGRFSFEAGLLSMLVSKDITVTKPRNGCRMSNGDFERHLPCEGNVSISPVAALYVGATAGTEDIGLVTLMPMVGLATTSLDGSIRPYTGIAIGLVNLSKTFNLF